MSGPGHGGPARGYSWEPFASGHTKSLRSGGESQRCLSPVGAELRTAVAESAPWTLAPAFAPTLTAWLWAEARCILYRRWFDEHGLWGDDGEPQPGLTMFERAEGRAAQLRAEL